MFLSVNLSFVSAAYSGFDIPFSPSELLENEWLVFGAMFLIFFAFIFFAIKKQFDNDGIALIISLALSLLISATLANKVRVYGYFGSVVGSWIIIIVAVVGLFFASKFLYDYIGKIGILGLLAILWLFLHSTNPWDIFPYEIITDSFEMTYSLLGSWYALGVLVVVGIVMFGGKLPRFSRRQGGREVAYGVVNRGNTTHVSS